MRVTGLELIAHRGYARVAPENTISAVDTALAVGARFVEIDVQLSADRVPFLMHDRTLERMCGVAGSIGDRNASEVEQLRAAEREKFGERFASEPVATLERFVARICASQAHAFVELKRVSIERFGPDAVLDAVVPLLNPIARRCTLISFDVDVLSRTRARFPHRVGPVLITWSQLESGELAALRPDVIFCDVEKLPQTGPLTAPGELAVYEVDSAVVARDLHGRGVRFIETFAIGELMRDLS